MSKNIDTCINSERKKKTPIIINSKKKNRLPLSYIWVKI